MPTSRKSQDAARRYLRKKGKGLPQRSPSNAERISALERRQQPQPNGSSSSGGGSAFSAPKAVASAGSSKTLTALLLGWFVLVAYGAAKSQVPRNEKDAAVAAAVVAALVVGFVGEVAPELAVGFAGILLVSMLLAGPANGFKALTEIPKTVLQQKG